MAAHSRATLARCRETPGGTGSQNHTNTSCSPSPLLYIHLISFYIPLHPITSPLNPFNLFNISPGWSLTRKLQGGGVPDWHDQFRWRRARAWRDVQDRGLGDEDRGGVTGLKGRGDQMPFFPTSTDSIVWGCWYLFFFVFVLVFGSVPPTSAASAASLSHTICHTPSFTQTDRQTDRPTNRPTDGRTDGPTDRQTDRQTDREAN